MDHSIVHKKRTAINWPLLAAFGAAIVLISPLLPIPLPGFVTGLPWKAELFSSVFLLSVFVSFIAADREALWQVFQTSREIHFSIIGLSLVAFSLWAAISGSWSAAPRSAIHFALCWSLFLTTALVISNRSGSKALSTKIAVMVILFLSALCIIDLSTSDFAVNEGTFRIRYAKFAEMLVALTPLVWGAALTIRKRNRAASLLALGSIGWLVVMVSLSKGAFIAGLVGYLCLFATCGILMPRRRRRTLAFAAVWIVFTLAVQLSFSIGTSVPSTADYISGRSDPTRSTTNMRLFTWKVGYSMAAENWLIGVGANNFGLAFNEARQNYAAKESDDPELSIAEEYLVERAHDEPLQIFAELGVVGFSLAAVAFVTFIFWIVLVLRQRRFSPIFFASLSGIIGFGISSLFSSFSFRATQNGLAFAIVFGIAVRYLRRSCDPRSNKSIPTSLVASKPLASLSLAFLIALVSLSATMGLSRYFQLLGERAATRDEQIILYRRAAYLDSDNAAAIASYASALAGEKRYHEAALAMRSAIDKGIGVTQIYSIMAEYQTKGDDLDGAEKTVAEAVSIFPRSVFARARYAQLLERNGRSADAAAQRAIALRLDVKQSNGWTMLLNEGGDRSMFASLNDPNVASPSELKPAEAVFQFIDKDVLTRHSKP